MPAPDVPIYICIAPFGHLRKLPAPGLNKNAPDGQENDPNTNIKPSVEGKNIGAPQNSEKHKTAQKSSRINIFQRKLMHSTQKNERNPNIK